MKPANRYKFSRSFASLIATGALGLGSAHAVITAVQVDFGATGGAGNGTTAVDVGYGTTWNGWDPAGSGTTMPQGGTTTRGGTLFDSLNNATSMGIRTRWASSPSHFSRVWDLFGSSNRDGDYFGLRDNFGKFNTTTFTGLDTAQVYTITVWTGTNTDVRVAGTTQVGLAGSKASNGLNPLTFEHITPNGLGEIAVDWGHIITNRGGGAWADVSAMSIAIPEPSSTALLGLGGLALLLRRRK